EGSSTRTANENAAGPAVASATPTATSPAAATTAAPGQQQGKVIETMNSGGYTYALVETAAGNVWVAGPETVVSVGDVVSFPPGTPMEKFRSDTLGREFARIDFVTSLDVVS